MVDTHKGTIQLTSNEEWVVAFANAKETLPLHPEDVKEIDELTNIFDNVGARVLASPEVEFTIVSVIVNEGGLSRLKHFAKLYRIDIYQTDDQPMAEEENIKTWDASELYDILEEYRGYAYGNGLSAAKLNEWWDKNIAKQK